MNSIIEAQLTLQEEKQKLLEEVLGDTPNPPMDSYAIFIPQQMVNEYAKYASPYFANYKIHSETNPQFKSLWS